MFELTIGIVGATGVVGQTALDVLADTFKGFSVKKIRVFASRSSIGKKLPFATKQLTIEETTLESLAACDAVLFASDAEVSKQYIPQLASLGVLCVDKSSAYREHPEVPLVVPEVNAHRLAPDALVGFPVVANPNCCATPLVVALKPLHAAFGIKRVIVSTYQSVSGAGKPGMEVLDEEARAFFMSEDLGDKPSPVFPKQIAFNVMPFVASILPSGDTDEEAKIIAETRKILELPDLKIAATSVRVPTFVGHAESVSVELSTQVTVAQVRALLTGAPGIEFIDEYKLKANVQNNDEVDDDIDDDTESVTLFATPRDVQGKDPVFVSRVRGTTVFDGCGISLWICADNLRKGAALNAIQIIDHCCRNGVMAALAQKRVTLRGN